MCPAKAAPGFFKLSPELLSVDILFIFALLRE